jgi:hypothetical protein
MFHLHEDLWLEQVLLSVVDKNFTVALMGVRQNNRAFINKATSVASLSTRTRISYTSIIYNPKGYSSLL